MRKHFVAGNDCAPPTWRTCRNQNPEAESPAAEGEDQSEAARAEGGDLQGGVPRAAQARGVHRIV